MVLDKTRYNIQEFDLDCDKNKKDILTYAVDRLSNLLPNVNEARLQSLASKLSDSSKGLFIWIVLVLGDIAAVDDGKLHVTKKAQLKSLRRVVVVGGGRGGGIEEDNALILRLEQSAALDLQELYCRALQTACRRVEGGGVTVDEEAVLRLKISLGFCLVAKEPISMESIGKLAVLTHEDIDLDVEESLGSVQSLWKCDSSASGNSKISFIHKTVTEYLEDIKCHSSCKTSCHTSCNSETQLPSQSEVAFCCHNQSSQLLQIDLKMTSLDMALACLSFLNLKTKDGGELVKNMAQPQLNGSEGPRVWPSGALCYTVSYWANHFGDAFDQNPDQRDKLVEALQTFCFSKLPFYLEALLLLNKINDVFRVVESVNTRLEGGNWDETDRIKSILLTSSLWHSTSDPNSS
ncbi:hypothetical protein HDU98_006488 [Podochytrium sp. JEL0797]|nr:hypothetical protein HDU98_006488 [Podochytrium sp. JEL0797]